MRKFAPVHLYFPSAKPEEAGPRRYRRLVAALMLVFFVPVAAATAISAPPASDVVVDTPSDAPDAAGAPGVPGAPLQTAAPSTNGQTRNVGDASGERGWLCPPQEEGWHRLLHWQALATRDELVSLRNQGVSPDEMRRANARAGSRLAVAKLRELAARGWRWNE